MASLSCNSGWKREYFAFSVSTLGGGQGEGMRGDNQSVRHNEQILFLSFPSVLFTEIACLQVPTVLGQTYHHKLTIMTTDATHPGWKNGSACFVTLSSKGNQLLCMGEWNGSI